MRVGKPEPCALVKDFDDWNFMFNRYAGTLDPACPALSESSETITNSGNDDSTTTGLFVQIMTCKFRSKIEDVENLLNEFRTRRIVLIPFTTM